MVLAIGNITYLYNQQKFTNLHMLRLVVIIGTNSWIFFRQYFALFVICHITNMYIVTTFIRITDPTTDIEMEMFAFVFRKYIIKCIFFKHR